MEETQYHIPALLPQALEGLALHPDGVYVDATFGGGGHSRAILQSLDGKGHLYSFDQDADAAANAPDDSRFTFVYSNFRFLRNFLRYYGVTAVDGILADLGVSFHHFDTPERGFSFRFDGPLDMRMNRNCRRTAAEILNASDEEVLRNLLRTYGELSSAGRLASAIVRRRQSQGPFTDTASLTACVEPLLNPRQAKKELAMIFQALRIEVNDEMGALRDLLQQSVDVLRPGGRLAVITYHSLEDRMVKNFMRTGNIDGERRTDFFGRCEAPMRLLTSRPVVPDEQEILSNPRSRSAKLRVAEKI
ncbi:MAG: 16S rRNA (cytosine(1402)-N(4))-methyltransferase RsmH [Paramuribaculum sp.]|nr:16S rRNA (cytosine(1402)-N(4))-methyltransferase RsmH [Paramuribaculum sp.]